MKRFVRTVAVLIAAALALIATPALADAVVLSASLSGANQPGGGDADGAGSFRAEVETEFGDFCYVLSVTRTGKATAAYVRSAAADAKPGPLIKLDVTGPGNDMCIAIDPAVLKAIAADPGGHYVGVETAEFPGGAVRGALARQ